jgi:outer membrane lipoprotein SlyB
MKRITLTTGLVALSAVLLAACGTLPRSDNASDIRSRCETCGNIERIERVRLRDQQMDIGAGAVLGAIIGGVAGSQINSGDHETAAIAAGALAGGAIGHQIQKSNQRQTKGYQFDVRLDDGRWAQVTQLEKMNLRVGDRVIIRDHQLEYLR